MWVKPIPVIMLIISKVKGKIKFMGIAFEDFKI